jgi:hypothetical protein
MSQSAIARGGLGNFMIIIEKKRGGLAINNNLTVQYGTTCLSQLLQLMTGLP